MKTKQVTIEQARKLLVKGATLKARIGNRGDVETLIKDRTALENLKRLQDEGVQKFELYYTKEEKLPDNAIEINLDDAIMLIYGDEEICTIDEKGKEINFSSRKELLDYYKKCSIHGIQCKFYWYV